MIFSLKLRKLGNNFLALMKRNLIKYFKYLIYTKLIKEEDGKNFEILVKCFETVFSGKKFNFKEAKKECKKTGLLLNKTAKPV